MRFIFFTMLILFISCGERLMEEPEGLIPKEKMVDVLMDMAILNAAKSTNINVLKEHHIDPTDYVFKKHGIDSTIFVESDLYYASIPEQYEAIYGKVEERLEKEKKKWEEVKKVNDSLKTADITKGKAGKKGEEEK